MQKKNNGGLVAVSIVLGIILVALIVFTIALKAGSKKITLNPTKEKETVSVTEGSSYSSDEVSQQFTDSVTISKSGTKKGSDDEAAEGDYICEYSSDRVISEDDYKELEDKYKDVSFPGDRSLAQMIINEMYAKNGYQFSDSEMTSYFEKKDWYKDLSKSYTDMEEVTDLMTSTEKDNIKFLKKKM